MKYKPFNDIIKQIRYAKAVSEGAEITEDNKENQEETFQAIREPGIRKGPLKGTKGFSPLLLLFCVVLTIFYLNYYLG
jgi:hypothetical protein